MRFKGLMVAALAATLVAAGSGSAFADGHHGHFEDLGNAQWAASAIDTLTAQGLIQGLTPTQFAPQQPVTIGQLAAILLRYQGGAQAGASFGAQVSQAQQDGYLSGLGGSVGSSEDATRAQAMTMIMDALGVSAQNVQIGSLGQFSDGSGVPSWARGPMDLAVEAGILQGSSGSLLPQDLVTRAQLAVILLRVETDLGQLLASSGSVGHAGSVAGTVTAIGNGQITVAANPALTQQSGQGDDQGEDGSGNLPGGTYTVSPFVKVVIPGEGSHGSLSQVQVGDVVRLVVHPGGQVRMIIVLPQTAPGTGTSQGAPANLSATETTSGIALSWTPVSGATYYQVLVSSGSGYAQVASSNGGMPTASATTVTGLAVGVSYSFEVQAVASGTASAPSSPSAAVEWGAKSGTSATITTSTSGGEEWLSIAIPYDKTLSSASLDGYLGDYTLLDTSTGQALGVAGVAVNGSTLTMTSGSYPATYFSAANEAFQITSAKSVVADSAGAPTTPIDATGSLGTATAPTNLSAAEAANGISLTWTPVSGATYYQVLALAAGTGTYAPVASSAGGTPTADVTTVTGLSAGTSYSFEVEAVDASGQASAPSSPSAAVEWGAKAAASASVAVNQAGSLQSFTITVAYDKALVAASLDTSLSDYRLYDATTGQYLSAASVSVVGNTLVIETALNQAMSLSGTLQVTTQKSVVNDSAGAPTAPISATGTL